MLTYFSVATSTTNLITAVNTVYGSWGSGAFLNLTTIILSTLFAMIVLGYVVKTFSKHQQ